MKIIFIGDIVGKNAREAVIKIIPDLRSKYQSDVIICNAENAAAGYGLTKKITCYWSRRNNFRESRMGPTRNAFLY